MRANYFPEDLHQRLVGGVIMYKKHPYYVSGSEDNNIRLDPLNLSVEQGKRPFWVYHCDPDLDVSVPQLGYINHDGKAFYVSREATRRSRQSVDSRGLQFFDPLILDQSRVRMMDSVLVSKSFEMMLLNIYPSVKSSIEGLDKGHFKSLAVSKDICITVDRLGLKRVFYQDFLVGFISPESPTKVTLSKDKYSYILQRYLKNFIKELSE